MFESFFLVICFAVFSTTSGCGIIPIGQGRTLNFTLTDFKLPAAMVYSDDPTAPTKVATISTSQSGAETFVKNLVRQTVEDVLYQQGRNAFLPDYLISSILQQLEIQVSYDPLKCEKIIDTTGAGALGMMKINCVVTGDTVTNICMDMNPNMCVLAANAANYKPINSKYTTISGSLSTTNAIMANWSNQMWESVLSRVLRSITSGPNGMYFNGASSKLN